MINQRQLVFVDTSAFYAIKDLDDDHHREIAHVSKADQRAAWKLFKKHDDKEFSFTDCTSFVVMERLGLLYAFAFDEHFEQTGQFTRVPRL